MTKAFIFEVATADGQVLYLNLKNRLTRRPYFFSSALALKNAGKGPSWRRGLNYYNVARDANNTTAIVSDNLEGGLRQSKAERLSYSEFEQRYLQPKPSRFLINDVFKIKLAKSDDRLKKEFVGPGKFGKTWETAGQVRTYISANLYRLFGTLCEAEVLQITLGPDKITPAKITSHKLKDFYLASPSSAKFYASHRLPSSTSW